MYTDKDLQENILAELNWDPSLQAGQIGVAVVSGIATLSGSVETFGEKSAAEAAARRVKGVLAVAEEIDVKLPFDARRGDSDIAKAASERIAWDAKLPKDKVVITVEQGHIVLSGEVEWNYQREAAEDDISGLYGVVSLTNAIHLKHRVNTETLSDDITHALHRSWFFDPVTFKVTADGGRIRLSGKVATWHDRGVAAATAWGAPGVTSVENHLTVG